MYNYVDCLYIYSIVSCWILSRGWVYEVYARMRNYNWNDLSKDTIPTSIGKEVAYRMFNYWDLEELAIKHCGAPDDFNLVNNELDRWRNDSYYIESLDFIWDEDNYSLDRSVEPSDEYKTEVIEAIQNGTARCHVVISELYRLGVIENTEILVKVSW